ncbi:DNA sulfur modification protein DndB [Endozoicomonas sp. ONNA1]|uniref:DNA sulfur modification protein DndB n=1 Tax=Endozoicomonas sp. ONNA1 TaxID=2828740 RepID=UPI0021484ABB|nr:DNA sulfur modification protein DndB [Endozoicomonas sp. ONNA1]
MSAYFVFATQSVSSGEKGSYEQGTCVSRHKSYSTALDKSDKLNKRHGRHRGIFDVITSDDEFKSGEVYKEFMDGWLIEEEKRQKISWLSEILMAEKDGDDHRLKQAVEMVSINGWVLDELKEQFSAEANQEIDRIGAKQQEYAAKEARRKANYDSLVKSRSEISYTFPAVRGIQAGKEYYTAQVPIKHLIKLFRFDEEEVPVELRAQRKLNEKRAKSIAQYMLDNPANYVLPAITACVSAAMSFEPTPVAGASDRLGLLNIPLEAMMLIVDGQHRRRGAELAVRECPELKNESLAVTLYYDQGLRSNQQMFSDINCSAVKPSTAISAVYNHRCEFGLFIKELLNEMPEIKSRIEMETTSVGKQSYKLWSLISVQKFIYHLFGLNKNSFPEVVVDTEYSTASEMRKQYIKITKELFENLKVIPQWAAMISGSIPAPDVRDNFVIGHAVFLEAIGQFAGQYICKYERGNEVDWSHFEKLSNLDVMRSSDLWNGRCVLLGKMNKTADGVKGTAAQLCKALGLGLTIEMELIENRLQEDRQ